jgi:hypothetical protein
MRDQEVANMLAVMADSEARSTASLVELIAATVLFKLTPPVRDSVVEVVIAQGDIEEAMTGFFYKATYEDGTMTLRLSRDLDSLEVGQTDDATEVTSEK